MDYHFPDLYCLYLHIGAEFQPKEEPSRGVFFGDSNP